ncbi:PepSY-associated TM helix domain-containing protein [Thalassotalea piscium]|uniref:Putative iron-regulated membrane protein n=1 Tax=Thalassotalea piscium TaxID=1230533 RepID=A0A7X0TSY2_9GAMM|nr:PepSY-associated TM helix domain-containing protein [Thalassotalea piscium]MBB6542657.1 putative iron-regulated membrane protein [Thalassotalea piscium]
MVHTWAGFSFGWLLYFIFVTGTVGYFDSEIDRWMKPEITVVEQLDNQSSVLSAAELQLQQLAPESSQWYISLPTARMPFVQIQWLQLANKETNTPRGWQEKYLDVKSGVTNSVRETAGGETLYRMHYNLHYVPELVGYILTSLVTMLMLIGLVTGVVIHKKIFIEFFTFRAKKGIRSWLDIHNIFSVLPLPFHLMITYSGLLLLMGVTMSSIIDVRYGEGRENHKKFYDEAQLDIKEVQFIDLAPEALSIETVLADVAVRYKDQKVSFIGFIERGSENEHYEIWFDKYEGIHLVSAVEYRVNGDKVEIEIATEKAGSAARIYDLFEHLHEGLFANIYLRWLYFISGLLGSAMVATGMILWIKKRQINGASARPFSVISIIERINIGIILGLPIAIAGYFWGNRLLPVNIEHRADWEVHCFFIALLASICFCLCRSVKKSWLNLLWFTAGAYLLTPLVNMVTTEHSIIGSIKRNDWLMLGFDLSMLFFAGCFALAAIIVQRKNAKAQANEEHIVIQQKLKESAY